MLEEDIEHPVCKKSFLSETRDSTSHLVTLKMCKTFTIINRLSFLIVISTFHFLQSPIAYERELVTQRERKSIITENLKCQMEFPQKV
jgi:uncharacterized membrane protein